MSNKVAPEKTTAPDSSSSKKQGKNKSMKNEEDLVVEDLENVVGLDNAKPHEPKWKEAEAPLKKKEEKVEENQGFWAKLKGWFVGTGTKNEIHLSLSDCDLSLEELEELKVVSVFSEKEIKIVRLRFKQLAGDQEWIPKLKLCELPELENNPLKARIAECFEADHDGLIDFKEFIIGFSTFSANGSREKKILLAFKMQDYDGDDKISKADLKQYLHDITRFKQTQQDLEESASLERKESEGNCEDVESRIAFNKKRVEDLKEESKNTKDKETLRRNRFQIRRHLDRIKSLESEGILDRVVDLTFEEASGDREFITRDDFVRVIGHSDNISKIFIDLTRIVRLK